MNGTERTLRNTVPQSHESGAHSSQLERGSRGRVRLVHRLMTLAACAIALTGCATATEPSNAAASKFTVAPPLTYSCGSETMSGKVTIGLEPPVQVGDVSAAYLTITASGPDSASDDVSLIGVQAVSQSGEPVEPIDLDDAIKGAGGEDKLASALIHLSSATSAVLREAGRDMAAISNTPLAILFIGFYGAGAAGMFAIAAGVNAYNSRHLRLEQGEINSSGRLHNGEPAAGYLFFPRGNYAALDIQISDLNAGDIKMVKCPWQ